jgi:hypothetical protein
MRGSSVRVLGLLGVTALMVVVGLAVARPALGAVIRADDNASVEESQRTRLLFPFLVNGFGIKTIIAVTNTSADPYGTEPKRGQCTFHFYGLAASDAIVSDMIEPGGIYAIHLSETQAVSQGYAIADCNFPFARGVAFVKDESGTNDFNGSYPAEVIKNDRPTP